MQFLARQLGRWPVALAAVIALAAAALLPGLDSFGLWEPQERQLADKIAPREDFAKWAAGLMAGKRPEDVAPKPLTPPPNAPKDPCVRQVPKDALARSLGTRAPAWGRDTFGDSDGGRRLPFALLGFFTVLAAAGIAMRMAGPRAGVITALIALSMPLLVFQARQLTSEIGTAAGAALVLYGLVSLGRGRGVLGAVDAVVSLVALFGGIAIGFLGGGALLGVLVPVGAYAAAGGLGVPALGTLARAIRCATLRVGSVLRPRLGIGRSCDVVEGEVPVGEQLKVLVATLVAFAVIGVLAYQLYELREPQPGLVPPQRALLGKAIVPGGCYSSALGAIWRPDDDLRFIYDSMFEQIAYGTFPWGILAPIAIAGLIATADRERRQLGALALAWAGGAWIASEMFQRKVGFNLWAGFPALAVAIGAWLDGVLGGRTRGERGGMPAGAMLVGLFVAFAVLDLGKDIQAFTERLTSLLVGGEAVPYPTMSKLLFLPTKLWVLILGLYVAVGFALAMITWRPPAAGGAPAHVPARRTLLGSAALLVMIVIGFPVSVLVVMIVRWDADRASKLRLAARIGAATAAIGTVLLIGFWPFVWQAKLASHLSSKAMFDTYEELKKPGDALVIMGDMGDAPHDYAPDATPETVTGREQIVAALGRPNRVFAVAPQTELCQLHREVGGKPYFVIDDRNLRSLLLSNKVDGTTDKNPLRTTILHAEPAEIPIRPKAKIVFDSRIQLLGWDIPKVVGRGSKFQVKMFYKVLQPVGGNWTVLFHFDGPLRFNGDHAPINGRCTTATWQLGDYIVDTYTVMAGGGAFSKGPYEVWTGFFTGSSPNWKNMPVSEAPGDLRDNADRVKITTINLD